MIKITNLGAILILIYLGWNIKNWTIIENEKIFISKNIINFIDFIPSFTWKFIYITLLFILFYNIIRKNPKGKTIVYMISMYILYFGMAIAVSQLSLKDTTILTFFKVYHPVNIELKIYFFNIEMAKYINHYFPNIRQDEIFFMNQTIFKEYDKKIIEKMNAEQISELAHNIVTEKNKGSYETIKILGLYVIIVFVIKYILNTLGEW